MIIHTIIKVFEWGEKMIDLRDIGLMTFPNASERWNYERSYVYQQFNKNPEKFLKGSVTFLEAGGVRGTFVITREGMEYLTGKTEEQANEGLWRVYVEKQFQILDEQPCNSQDLAESLMKEITYQKMQAKQDVEKVAFHFLDDQNRKYGTRLQDGLIIYYKKAK